MYGDVEAVLVTFLSAVPGIAAAAVKMPEKPPLPFVLITRISGGDDYVTDRAVVDVEVFTADRTTSSDMARTIHGQMLTLRHMTVGGVLVDYVDVLTGPTWMDYGDELLQRHLMSYRIESRAPRH